MITIGTHKKTGAVITRDGVKFDGTPGTGFSWWSSDGGRSLPGEREGAGETLDSMFKAARNNYLEDVVDLTEEGWNAAQECDCGGTRRKGSWQPKRPPTPSPYGAGNNRKARKERQRARQMQQRRAVEKALARLATLEAEHGARLDEIARQDEARRERRAEAARARRARKKGSA